MEEIHDSDWSWSEPTDDEFNQRCKSETFYRIYTIDKDGAETNVYKFWTDCDESAYATLQRYRDAVKDDGRTYYYSTSGYHVDWDGRRFDSLAQLMARRGSEGGWWTRFKGFARWCIWERLLNLVRQLRDTLAFHTTRHSRDEWWGLDYHLLEDLRYNIPILIKRHVGIPTYHCEAARKTLNRDVSENGEYGGDVMRLAERMWEEDLFSLLENVLAYMYYDSYGHVDKSNPDMANIDRKLAETLPHKPGTNHALDYAKLDELKSTRWNAIWKWIGEKGEMLWD